MIQGALKAPQPDEREKRMKKKKQQQGFTLVETILACALLMMIISILGSLTILTLNLSYRTKEASQVEIMADTLANRVDEILRDAQYVKVYPNGTLDYYSPDYPKYYREIEDEDGNKSYDTTPKYATLRVPSEDDFERATSEADRDMIGKLCISYADREYPVGYLLLPNDSYEHMTASLSIVSDETIPDDGMELHGAIRLNITLNGTNYHTSCSRDFTVLLPNC